MCVLAWGICAAVAVGTLLVPGSFSAAPAMVLGAAGAASLIGALLWAPALHVDDDGIDVDNIVRRFHVPWAALIHVDTRYALQLHTPGRLIAVTAAPAPGAGASLRAARIQRRHGGVAEVDLRPGDLPTTDSGRAAALVRGRWRQLRDAGLIEAGVADATPVGVRPYTRNLALMAIGAAALVASVLLV